MTHQLCVESGGRLWLSGWSAHHWCLRLRVHSLCPGFSKKTFSVHPAVNGHLTFFGAGKGKGGEKDE